MPIEVKLLGVKVKGIEQKVNKIKKNEALVYSIPKTVKELRRFLGMVGWFRFFINSYAERTFNMTES